MPFRLLEEDVVSVDAVESAVTRMKAMLIYSIVFTEENNWILIILVEAYCQYEKTMLQIIVFRCYDKGFSTPDQLKRFRIKPIVFIAICSKLLYFAINENLTEAEANTLEDSLIELIVIKT